MAGEIARILIALTVAAGVFFLSIGSAYLSADARGRGTGPVAQLAGLSVKAVVIGMLAGLVYETVLFGVPVSFGDVWAFAMAFIAVSVSVSFFFYYRLYA